MGVVGGESPPGARSPCCHVTTTSQRLPNETGKGSGRRESAPPAGCPRLRNGRGERKEGGAEGRGRYRQTEARYGGEGPGGQARGGAGQG